MVACWHGSKRELAILYGMVGYTFSVLPSSGSDDVDDLSYSNHLEHGAYQDTLMTGREIHKQAHLLEARGVTMGDAPCQRGDIPTVCLPG